MSWTDVELLSPKELMSFILRMTGEAVDVEEINDEEQLRRAARLAAMTHLGNPELKKIVASAGLSAKDCITRGDLKRRGVEAVQRLRWARKLPTLESLRADISRRKLFRQYEVVFQGSELGLAIGLTGGKRVVATKVTRDDVPALQPGDEVILVNDFPFYPCSDTATFRQAVLARLRDAPRPLKLTFAVGDNRWPPDLPSNHDIAVRRRNPTPPKTWTTSSSESNQKAEPSIKEMRATIRRAGLSPTNVIEKDDLRRLLTLAQQKLEEDRPSDSKSWDDFIIQQQRIAEQREETPPKATKRRPPPPPPKTRPPANVKNEEYTTFLSDDVPPPPAEANSRIQSQSFVAAADTRHPTNEDDDDDDDSSSSEPPPTTTSPITTTTFKVTHYTEL